MEQSDRVTDAARARIRSDALYSELAEVVRRMGERK
jgi:hypothetical protein